MPKGSVSIGLNARPRGQGPCKRIARHKMLYSQKEEGFTSRPHWL